MSCIKQILSRRSIRKYKNNLVSEEVINNILEAGRQSPSATNNQPWHFVIAKTEEAKEACDFQRFNQFVKKAAFVIIGFYKQSEVILRN